MCDDNGTYSSRWRENKTWMSMQSHPMLLFRNDDGHKKMLSSSISLHNKSSIFRGSQKTGQKQPFNRFFFSSKSFLSISNFLRLASPIYLIYTCKEMGMLLRAEMVRFSRISPRLMFLGMPSMLTWMGFVLRRGWGCAILRPWNGDSETASTDHWPPCSGAFIHVA